MAHMDALFEGECLTTTYSNEDLTGHSMSESRTWRFAQTLWREVRNRWSSPFPGSLDCPGIGRGTSRFKMVWKWQTYCPALRCLAVFFWVGRIDSNIKPRGGWPQLGRQGYRYITAGVERKRKSITQGVWVLIHWIPLFRSGQEDGGDTSLTLSQRDRLNKTFLIHRNPKKVENLY